MAGADEFSLFGTGAFVGWVWLGLLRHVSEDSKMSNGKDQQRGGLLDSKKIFIIFWVFIFIIYE